MVTPADVLDAIQNDAEGLDYLTKELGDATHELDGAEEAWDELYDAVAEALKDEMAEAGRKGDPAEHTIVSITRRQHRAEYQRLRRAKRQLDKLEKQLGAKRAAMSGRQSQLNGLKDEAAMQDRLGQRADRPHSIGGVAA